MLIGFSKHGTGGAGRPIKYLTAETTRDKPLDYLTGKTGKMGVRRDPAPVVVRGDPTRTKALIDSLSFKHKYTSGVLSFSPGEVITPEMEKSIIEQFERTAFAGLERDQYDILWVRHSHTSGGRHELHFLIPRVELRSGRSINIAPPRKSTREMFDALRTKINREFGLADPGDPANARAGRRDPEGRSGPTKTKSTAKSPGLKTDTSNWWNLDSQELESRLDKLIEKRTEYHRSRYCSPSPDRSAETELLISPPDSYDRTGTPSFGGPKAPGIELSGTRSSLCENAPELERTTDAWDRAHGNFERATERFGRAHGEMGAAIEQEVIVGGENGALALLLKYAIPIRSRSTDQDMPRDTDMELDIPFG